MLDFWPLQLTRAYLGESSIARAVEKGSDLSPYSLSIRSKGVCGGICRTGLGVGRALLRTTS